MEMRASEDIDIGKDLSPPLLPLVFSLHDSSFLSHCSACFSPLSPSPHQVRPLNSHPVPPNPSALYCSPQCSMSDTDLHLSSAEHLLQSDIAWCPHGSADLRAALRLLRQFENRNIIPREGDRLERIGGLMSNREKLMSCRNEEDEGEFMARIRDGAKAMAIARRMRDDCVLEISGECVLEEAVLCVVLTNAVDVQVNGGAAVGIAVYDTTFSWINHSCSPNACYWFSLKNCSGGESRFNIFPAFTGGCSSDGIEVIQDGDSTQCESTEVGKGYGPRIVVRSIKAITKGEEVSIAYTDLLQPTVLRQSELWLKYRFVCFCRRCSAWPPTYVDHSLQEISAVNCNSANLSFDLNYRDEVINWLSAYLDDAIAAYLTFGDAQCCCERIENLLTNGLLVGQCEPKEEKLKQQLWLHPLHHLSLSAYTTLASAYKTRASDFLSLDTENDKLQAEAFKMSRTSAAYSLLLAVATHHLFISEYSLIASAASFWTSAGESLLNVARSPVWKLYTTWGSSIAGFPSFPSYKCCNCALVNRFERNFAFGQAQNLVFKDVSTEFLKCIRSITPKVWNFLVHQGCPLKLVKDPIDFRWIGSMKCFKTLDLEANLGEADEESSISRDDEWMCLDQENVSLFQLGVHCLLYGGFLSGIVCGKQSDLAVSFISLLSD